MRLAAEFGVIVVGVLVALLAESAWQERGESLAEHDALLRIRADLAADSVDLLNDELNRGFVFPAQEEARQVLAGTDTLSDAGALTVLYVAALRNPVRAPRGTWYDLTSAGRSDLISNPALRQHLINFYTERERRDRSRADMPVNYRNRVISVLPLDLMSTLLERCIRREGDKLTQGARPGGLQNLTGCDAVTDAAAIPYLRRLRALPDLDLFLGELNYYTYIFFTDELVRTRLTFEALVVALDRELANGR